MMDELSVKDLENVVPEMRAALWESLVRKEVNDYLDIFLPEAITGNIGILYDRPVLEVDSKTGEKILDNKAAKGVKIIIEFAFAEPVKFFDKKPD